MGLILITRPRHREIRTLRPRVTQIELLLVTILKARRVEGTGQTIILRAAVHSQVERKVDEGTVRDAAVSVQAVAAKPGVRVEYGQVGPIGLVSELVPVRLGAGVVALLLKGALVRGHEVAMPG